MADPSTRERFPLVVAKAYAEDLCSSMAPVCDRVAVVGSVRRGKTDVGDIELLMIPKFEPAAQTLFGGSEEQISSQLVCVEKLIADGVLQHRLDKNGHKCCGTWMQRVVYQGVPVDFFCCTAEQWGLSMVIRTGPADFSQKMATERSRRGFLPDGFCIRGFRVVDHFHRLETPEEIDVFNAIGMRWIEPRDRR